MSNKQAGAKKGRPTPKRNASKNVAKAQQRRSANFQWFVVAGVIVAIIVVIFVLAALFYDPPAYVTDLRDGLR